VDAEGWIHTGDVAEVDSCGRFKIVDRVKVNIVRGVADNMIFIIIWTEHHEARSG